MRRLSIRQGLAAAALALLFGTIGLAYGGLFTLLSALRAPAAPRAEAAIAAPLLTPPVTPMTPAPQAKASAKASEPYPSDPAELVRALRPLQREVDDGLASLARWGHCHWGDTFAQLELETREGEVLVRGVELRQRPQATDALHDAAAMAAEPVQDGEAATCIVSALRGKTFHAPSARPGRRWQTFYSL